MDSIFTIISRVSGAQVSVKYDDGASTVLVWRNKEAAKDYLTKKGWNWYEVAPFSFQEWDRSKKWHKEAGMDLFIHFPEE